DPIRLYLRFVSNSAAPIRLYLRFVSNSAKYYAYSSNCISSTSPPKIKKHLPKTNITSIFKQAFLSAIYSTFHIFQRFVLNVGFVQRSEERRVGNECM